jgi:Glycosyl transferase family 11
MKANQVKVNLRGGLGNQLFQYGAGYAIAKKLDYELVIDASQLPFGHEIHAGLSFWPEQISQFQSGALIVQPEANKGKPWLAPRFLQLERWVGDVSNGRLNPKHIYANEQRGNLAKFGNLVGKNIRLNAYCGSPKYFLDYTSEIRRNVRSLINPSDEFQSLTKMIEAEGAIAIHIRLGDYANFSNVYGGFDTEYYHRALETIYKLAGERPVWLFSDEKERLSSLVPDLVALDCAPEQLSRLSGLETINLIAKACALVASNSSFSWWGAFLATNPGFTTIFPSPLFAPGGPAEPKHFIQPGWLQIGRRIV